MRVCHFNSFTPKMQGMYETIAELIVAQNRLGLDSGMYDEKIPNGGKSDDRIKLKDKKWAMDADVYIIHSLLPQEFWNRKPTLFFAHGMPEALLHDEMAYDGVKGFRLSREDKVIVTTQDKKNIDCGRAKIEFMKESPFSTFIRYMTQDFVKGTVTCWERHHDIWKSFCKDKLCEFVQGGVDLQKYTRRGKHNRLNGEVTGVYGERFRFVKHPFLVLRAMEEVAKEHPEVRIHNFGCEAGQLPMWNNIFHKTGWTKFSITLNPIHPNLDEILRANDFLLSPVQDSSRIAKESLACGMPIISKQNHYTDYVITDDIFQAAEVISKFLDDYKSDKTKMREKARKIAVKNFDINNTAKGMIKIYDKIQGS